MAHRIVAAAASARALAYHYACPVCHTWRSDYSDEDCKQLARAVVFEDVYTPRKVENGPSTRSSGQRPV